MRGCLALARHVCSGTSAARCCTTPSMFLLIELTWGGIRSGILESDGFDRLMNQVLQTVASADSAGALINLSRTSDRHRSVGFGFEMFHLLRSRGYLVELIHWNSSHWSEMARGGRNACCQDIQGSFRVLRHLVPNPVRSVVGHPVQHPSPPRETASRRGLPSAPPPSRTSSR